MVEHLKRRWFLLLLCFVLVVGMSAAEQLEGFAKAIPKDWVIAAVLFAMSLSLRTDAIVLVLRRPGPAVLAVVVNMLVLPLIALPASQLLNDDLAIGLIIASAVPCTLASASVWTRLAGGNDAVSMLVTVITNLTCFVVTPAWLLLLEDQRGESIDLKAMAARLFAIVILPMCLAQLMRVLPAVRRSVDSVKLELSTLAQIGVLVMVFIGAVFSGLQIAALDEELSALTFQLCLMIFLAAAIHLIAWRIGYSTAGAIGFARADQLAVAFAGSQKTLMVGLAIAIEYSGLAILPMLAYHVLQLLIDTLLADRCRAGTEPASKIGATPTDS